MNHNDDSNKSNEVTIESHLRNRSLSFTWLVPLLLTTVHQYLHKSTMIDEGHIVLPK